LTTTDQIAASIVGLTLGLICYAGMLWWDRKNEEEARQDREVFEELMRRKVVRAAEADFQTAYVEHYPVEGIADYWDRDDLITVFFEERVVQAGVDRPWAPRMTAARGKRAASIPVH
jgi:hypothetical protein